MGGGGMAGGISGGVGGGQAVGGPGRNEPANDGKDVSASHMTSNTHNEMNINFHNNNP